MSMETRYENEVKGLVVDDITELYLDNSAGGAIAGINDKLTKLNVLSMVGCGLTSLAGFPKLENLEVLDLSDNNLGKNPLLDILHTNAPNLIRIMLHGNKLTLESLRPLEKLQKLAELDLTDNDNLGLEGKYHFEVFKMIPSLRILDGLNDEEKEEEEAIEGGESDGEDQFSDDCETVGISYLDQSEIPSDDEDDDPSYVPPEKASTSRKRPASEDEEENEPEVKKPTNDE